MSAAMEQPARAAVTSWTMPRIRSSIVPGACNLGHRLLLFPGIYHAAARLDMGRVVDGQSKLFYLVA